MKTKDINLFVAIMVTAIAITVSAFFIFFTNSRGEVELTIETEPETVFIYEIDELISYEYRDTVLIYSYSTFGVHLVQLIRKDEAVYILEVKDRDEALRYIEEYLF